MSYSPVNINNPVSLCHLAKVWPGQRIELYLDNKQYPEPKVVANSFVRVEKVETTDTGTSWTIVQTGEFEEWAKYSSCFLGDVWIDSDVTVARIVVILQSSTPVKADHLTVINPIGDCIKIRPHQIIELVAYDERFGYQDEWNWSWDAGTDGIELDELGADHLTVFGFQNFGMSEIDDPEYRYARIPRMDVYGDDFCRQHHFWFRLSNSVLANLTQEKESQYLGLLSLRGYANQYQKHQTQTTDFKVALYADLKNKFRPHVVRALSIQPRGRGVLPPRKPINWQHVTHYPKKSHLPYLKEVSINKLAVEIGDGCKTAVALPPERQSWHQYNDEDFYFVGNVDRRHWTGMPGHKYRGEWD